jgi:hypothetical protein
MSHTAHLVFKIEAGLDLETNIADPAETGDEDHGLFG